MLQVVQHGVVLLCVLIETLWNVNLFASDPPVLHGGVLIETLWNVNGPESASRRRQPVGINRNIVECKYFLIVSHTCHEIVLIETLWNVNRELTEEQRAELGINRNIVECKLSKTDCPVIMIGY